MNFEEYERKDLFDNPPKFPNGSRVKPKNGITPLILSGEYGHKIAKNKFFIIDNNDGKNREGLWVYRLVIERPPTSNCVIWKDKSGRPKIRWTEDLLEPYDKEK